MEAISVEELWLSYPMKRMGRLNLRAIGRRIQRGKKKKWAIRGVTFDVPPGQMVGVIGRNGSGKSSLLRCLAGIYRPTKGTVTVRGHAASLIDTAAGFQRDLSLRENLYLAGALYGISRKDMEERLPVVLEFAELGDVANQALRSFSAGMLMRAGFSVTMALEPDVFLVDEVLAVGDESFKQKCLNKVRQMREDGSTIVFVTHELSLVRAFCDRVILMENGEIAFNGEVEPGIDTYCELIGVDKDVAMSRPPINQRTLDRMEKTWKRGR